MPTIHPAGGALHIVAECASNSWDPAGPPEVVHFLIQDSGLGISLQEQKSIFQKFFRSEDGWCATSREPASACTSPAIWWRCTRKDLVRKRTAERLHVPFHRSGGLGVNPAARPGRRTGYFSYARIRAMEGIALEIVILLF